MNRQVLVLLAAIAALCLAPTTSIAARVPLTPESVIGGSSSQEGDGSWDSAGGVSGDTSGGNIFDWDGITPPEGPPEVTTFDLWNGNSEGPEYLVIDLGSSYSIDRIDLYNTHNRQWSNYGTDNFRIEASNSVVHINDFFDFDLSGAVTTIMEEGMPGYHILSYTGNPLGGGSTKPSIENPITTVDSFSIDPTAPFQYLKIVLVDTTANGNRVGLNEMVVFGSIIPEPSTLVLAALGLLGLMGIRRRRNR